MTPESFVAALKEGTRKGARSTVEYLANPPVAKPPGDLGEFSALWRTLGSSQQETLKDLLVYLAEGSLFHVLNVLDNIVLIQEGDRGRLELRWVPEKGTSFLLNDPDGEFLYDMFNNTP